MLKIKTIMDSPVEEIFAFKCCGALAFDQNLEIHVTNTGDRPVVVPSYFDLEDDSGCHRVPNLMPHGQQVIEPHETIAFYCYMEQARWRAARRLIFYDDKGNRYPLDCGHAS
ncbi:MAG: hypothetical protein V1742_00785 [Pseudomonadota bacterium]